MPVLEGVRGEQLEQPFVEGDGLLMDGLDRSPAELDRAALRPALGLSGLEEAQAGEGVCDGGRRPEPLPEGRLGAGVRRWYSTRALRRSSTI